MFHLLFQYSDNSIKIGLLAALLTFGCSATANTNGLPGQIPLPPPPSLDQAGPGLQAKAEYWLRIKVGAVEQIDGQLNAMATVLEAYKPQEGLQVGDEIQISYKLEKQTPMQTKSRLQPPRGVPPLREGQLAYAFLNKEKDSDTFYPSAELWSFAPPFGLTPEDMKAVGMNMPKPPKMPTRIKSKTMPPKLQTPSDSEQANNKKATDQ